MTEDELRLAAVDRAYRDHVDDVYRVAFAILREPESASDAVHEAFARAFERWDRYDSARPLRPWLQRIVVNVALDAIRRRKVRAIAVTPLEEDRTGASRGVVGRVAGMDEGRSGDPATWVAQRALVDEGLAALGPAPRAAIVLRHYYGYDYAEIAAALGTSEGNVGSMLSRAHATLRARLAGSAAPEGPVVGQARRAAP